MRYAGDPFAYPGASGLDCAGGITSGIDSIREFASAAANQILEVGRNSRQHLQRIAHDEMAAKYTTAAGRCDDHLGSQAESGDSGRCGSSSCTITSMGAVGKDPLPARDKHPSKYQIVRTLPCNGVPTGGDQLA